MCKFTPCSPRVAHLPGECPSWYGENCDGIEHYVDDPYTLGMYDRTKLMWLCDGKYTEQRLEV